ncbi:MAG TPA: ACT domain-containing protein [Mycobacteriales bacterium]|nr:ACT domain-containing protein [Mycobacteriales bacterium]
MPASESLQPTATFARLRIDVPDHPGALAAIGRVLAGRGMNVVEVSIHEVEGDRATDEIVVQCAAMPAYDDLNAAIAGAGGTLLSVGPCSPRTDQIVVAMTWMTAMLDGPDRRQIFATGIRTIVGIDPVRVVRASEVADIGIVREAVSSGRVVVQHVARLPEVVAATLDAADATSGSWLLAASDGLPDGHVVLAARPYGIRFTSTELSRLAALIDCRRQLVRSRERELALYD